MVLQLGSHRWQSTSLSFDRPNVHEPNWRTKRCFTLEWIKHAKQLTINLRDGDGNAILKRQVSTRPGKVLEFFEQLTSRCARKNCKFRAIGIGQQA